MREIEAAVITDIVADLCISANCRLPDDIYKRISDCKDCETDGGAPILDILIKNADYAADNEMPICQDTGMAVIFADIGQNVHINGNLTNAINEGVRKGYRQGYLRKSVVSDPLDRTNTGDNTPAIIHYNITSGDKIKITLTPKGFGSENMSRIKMLKPADGAEGIISFVTDTVIKAGANPCPPIVIGVGIGGDFELCALLAKKALCLPISSKHENEFYENMRSEILKKVNALGIGPQGLGGNTTALAVNILTYPTHIASLPVAVNISCHVTRHVEYII